MQLGWPKCSRESVRLLQSVDDAQCLADHFHRLIDALSGCKLRHNIREQCGSDYTTRSAVHVSDVPVQIILNVTLSGGVAPSAIAAPSAGLLLRLSVACYLGMSPADVVLTAVTTTAPNVAGVALAPDAPVNTRSGNCSQVQSAGAARRRQRRLDAAATTTAYLALQTCRDASSPTGASAALGALLAALAASTNVSAAALAPFLNSAAIAAGVSKSSLVPVVAVGPPGASAAAAAPGAASASTAAAPSAALVASLAVVGILICITLCVLCLCLALRRRKRRREQERAKLALGRPTSSGATVAGVNPLHSRHKAPPLPLAAVEDAAALFPDPVLLPGVAMLPWKGNPAYQPPPEEQDDEPTLTMLPWKGNPAFKPAVAETGAARAVSAGGAATPRRAFTPRGPAAAAAGSASKHADAFLGFNPLRGPHGSPRLHVRASASPAGGGAPAKSLSTSTEDTRGTSPRRSRPGAAASAAAVGSPRKSPAPSLLADEFVGENPLRKRAAAAPLSPLTPRGVSRAAQAQRSGSVTSVPATPRGAAMEFSGANPLAVVRGASGPSAAGSPGAKAGGAPQTPRTGTGTPDSFSLDNPLHAKV